MKNHLFIRRCILSAVLFVVLISAGCASFPGKQLPTYSKETATRPADHLAVTYQVKAFVLDEQSSVKADAISKRFRDTLNNLAIAAESTANAQPDKYHFDVVFRNEGNLGLAFISGFISGFTFTLLPGYARDEFVFNVDVIRNGRILKSYMYKDYIDSWIHASMIFLMATHWPGDVSTNVVENMIMNFTNDFSKDLNSGTLSR